LLLYFLLFISFNIIHLYFNLRTYKRNLFYLVDIRISPLISNRDLKIEENRLVKNFIYIQQHLYEISLIIPTRMSAMNNHRQAFLQQRRSLKLKICHYRNKHLYFSMELLYSFFHNLYFFVLMNLDLSYLFLNEMKKHVDNKKTTLT